MNWMLWIRISRPGKSAIKNFYPKQVTSCISFFPYLTITGTILEIFSLTSRTIPNTL